MNANNLNTLHAHYGIGSGGGQWELAGEAYVDSDVRIDISDVVPSNSPNKTVSYFLIEFDSKGSSRRYQLEQPMPLQKVRSHTRYVSQGNTNPNWVMASILLLPKPRSKKIDASLPVLPIPSEKGYWFESIDLGVESAPPGEIYFIPGKATLMAPNEDVMTIDTARRLERIFLICGTAKRNSSEVDDAVLDFSEMVFGPKPFKADECQGLTNRIMKALSRTDADYIFGEDCLDALEAYFELSDASEAIPKPIDISQIPVKSTAQRMTNQRRWTRVASRGSEGRKFAKAINKAYDSTCLFCGVRLPRTEMTKIGVEAAHIVPWAKSGLNSVNNGLCLCRFHHWAFDERVIEVSFDGGDYVVDRGPFYDEFANEVGTDKAAQIFGQLPKTIDRKLLPDSPQDYPSPALLEEFNAYINSDD